MTASLELLLISRIDVPPDLNVTLLPAASNTMSAAGYTITVGRKDSGGSVISGTTDDFYTFTVDTNTATTGGVSGGGVFCTSGPATLES